MQIAALILLAFSTVLSWSQMNSNPVLRSGSRPVYPTQARTGRIQGTVVAQYEINPDGFVKEVKTISGPPPLLQAVLDVVQQWHFEVPESGFTPGRQYRSTFTFATVDSPLPELQVESLAGEPVRHVQVVAPSRAGTIADECPLAQDREPPASAGDDDYIELERTSCPKNCPAYTVRIAADGTVTYKGDSSVKETGDQHDKISSERARALIEQTRTPEFWSLCGAYRVNIPDQPSVIVRAHISGREKRVSNYAASAPPIMRKMPESIDAVADTRRWVYGKE